MGGHGVVPRLMGHNVMATSWSYGESDYRAIEDALMGSDYGRWFLGEYLSRNRSGETERLLDALDRLEASLGTGIDAEMLPRLREIALGLDTALSDALARIEPTAHPAAMAQEPPVEAIMEAVEDINSFLASMSARRVHQRLPEKIRARLSDIQRCCHQVDTSSAAAQSLTAVLTDLRHRLNDVGEHLQAADTSESAGAGQDTRLPRKLLDELSAALSPYAQAPAAR